MAHRVNIIANQTVSKGFYTDTKATSLKPTNCQITKVWLEMRPMLNFMARLLLAFSLSVPINGVALPAYAKDLVTTMKSDLGARRPGGCPNKWCACYMDLVLKEAGYTPLGSNRARDFAAYGKKTKPMSVGSIMVMPHHVGVVAGKCPDGRVKLISGNYSKKVGIGCYSPNKAIAWRSPSRG